jgi:outer membrane lipoprotein-sorting protein
VRGWPIRIEIRVDVRLGVIRTWRWACVVVLAAALAAAPIVVGRVPAGSSSLSAQTLLAMVQHSGSTAYSGYAEADGGLSLPVSTQFGSVADLFGGQTQLRVWWRGRTDWRVDAISLTGEVDEHRNGDTVWNWDYETNEATETVSDSTTPVRLPDSSDGLPSTLAQRLLSEAAPADVSRLPDRRIAGRDAPGIRLHPPQRGSTITEVDVWVDPGTGVPLAVDVSGAGTRVISTRFLDFSTSRPAASVTAFSPPRGAQVRTTQDLDIAQFIQSLGLAGPPATLAGIARNPALSAAGSIGVYGSGVTEFAVTPLFGRTARSLRAQLAQTAGVSTTRAGQAVTVGPLSLVITPAGSNPSRAPFGRDGSAWLLTGTVTTATLVAAANELVGASS